MEIHSQGKQMFNQSYKITYILCVMSFDKMIVLVYFPGLLSILSVYYLFLANLISCMYIFNIQFY